MSCGRDEALNALIDGQLRGEARAELEGHLAGCEPCRSRRDALDALRRDLESAFAPDGGAAAALAERIATSYEKPARSWRPYALAALAAAAGFLVAVLLRREPPAVDQRPAWEALEAVHAYGHQHPTDSAGFVARCGEIAKAWPNTDAARAARKAAASYAAHRCASPDEDPALAMAALRREISTALAAARTREDVDAALARLDVELNAPLSKERFAEARELLEAARARRPEPRWAKEVARRQGLLEARIEAGAAACLAAAKADPAGARVQRDRVAAWGVGDLLARFDREVKIEEPKPPAPAVEKGLLTRAVRGELMVKGPEPKPGQRVAPPLFVATREGALCAFETEGGDVLRVNETTRLMIEDKKPIALHEGELFVAAKGAVEIDCDGKKIRAKGATFEVSHRDLARMVKGPGRTQLRVLVLRGEVEVEGRKVSAGEMCAAVNGVFEPVGPAEDGVLETRWTHPLLDAAELRARASRLSMLLHDPRLGPAAERALRTMGSPAAAAMLPRLLNAKEESGRLKTMAALIADLAGPELVSEMIDRLGGTDAAVRTELARGLKRLTGQTMGPARSLWEAWLEKDPLPWGGEPRPKK